MYNTLKIKYMWICCHDSSETLLTLVMSKISRDLFFQSSNVSAFRSVYCKLCLYIVYAVDAVDVALLVVLLVVLLNSYYILYSLNENLSA